MAASTATQHVRAHAYTGSLGWNTTGVCHRRRASVKPAKGTTHPTAAVAEAKDGGNAQPQIRPTAQEHSSRLAALEAARNGSPCVSSPHRNDRRAHLLPPHGESCKQEGGSRGGRARALRQSHAPIVGYRVTVRAGPAAAQLLRTSVVAHARSSRQNNNFMPPQSDTSRHRRGTTRSLLKGASGDRQCTGGISRGNKRKRRSKPHVPFPVRRGACDRTEKS